VIDARTTGAAATAGVHAHLRRRALPGRRDRPIAGLLLRVWTEVSLSTLLALLGSAFVFGNISLIRIGGSAVLIVVIIIRIKITRRRVIEVITGVQKPPAGARFGRGWHKQGAGINAKAAALMIRGSMELSFSHSRIRSTGWNGSCRF